MAWDSAKKCSEITLSNSDRTTSYTYAAESYAGVGGTTGFSAGKVYFEVETDTSTGDHDVVFGVTKDVPPANWCSDMDFTEAIYLNGGGEISNLGVYDSTYAGAVGEWNQVGDIAGMAVDFTAGKFWFRVNGSWLGGGDPAAGTTPTGTFTTGGTYYPFLEVAYNGV